MNLDEVLAKLDTKQKLTKRPPKGSEVIITRIDFCQFPLCTRLARHRHHLTYRPEVTTRLCVRHHKHITIINCNQAFARGRKLSNRERLDIWHEWIEGRLKPIYTRSARAWVRKWRRRRT